MPRLFVGTFLSEEGAGKLARLASANANLDRLWNTKVRWVGENKLHITWLFLGEINSEIMPDLQSALGDAVQALKAKGSCENLILRYDRIELWPTERKAKLAVITPATVPDQIEVIASSIKASLKKFVPADQQMHEHKSFKPHLTAFRFSRDFNRAKHSLGATSIRTADIAIPDDIFPIEHPIAEIALIESDMGKQMQGYERLFSFDLT